MMPWVGQVSSHLFPSWVFARGSGCGEKSGFHSTIRGHGGTPRPPGSHTTPGAAFVQDSVRDTAVSLRSTPAARSPGWLLGSHPTLEPVARGLRVVRSGGGRLRRRGPPRLTGAEDGPAADQQLPRQRHHGLLLG